MATKTKRPAKKAPAKKTVAKKVKKASPRKTVAKKAAPRKTVAKKAAPRKTVAKKAAPPQVKKAVPRKTVAKKAPAPRRRLASGIDAHPGYTRLRETLKPGRYAGGMLFITKPGELDEQMGPWLMGNVEGRRALGRTVFGDIVIFRDLASRARELGLPGAETACDVAMIDIHRKRMVVLAHSAETFLDALADRAWQKAHLRADLYAKANRRLGDCADDECYGFVPALALGGREDASSVARANWRVHQDILLQT